MRNPNLPRDRLTRIQQDRANDRKREERDRNKTMVSIPVPHTARLSVTFHHNVEAVRGEHVFYVRDASDALFANPSAYAASFFNAWVVAMIPQQTPQYVADGVVFEDLRSVPYGGADYPQTPAAGSGGSGGTSLPTDTSLVFKKSTLGFGRSARGRIFWPIWDNGLLLSADTVKTANVSSIATQLNAFQTAVQALISGSQLGIVSFQHGGAPVSPGLFQQLTGFAAVDNHIDSQRRRLLGRGP